MAGQPPGRQPTAVFWWIGRWPSYRFRPIGQPAHRAVVTALARNILACHDPAADPTLPMENTRNPASDHPDGMSGYDGGWESRLSRLVD